jgi:hypothetical protein
MARDFSAWMRDGRMQTESQSEKAVNEPDRWVLLRDIAVLQVKLVVDGLRDFILVPVSLIAGVVSLVKSETGPDSSFYELLRLGKRSEHWINLFGAADRRSATGRERVHFPEEDIDAMVSRVETFVVDEYRKGGVTRQAKERLDKALDSLHKLSSRKERGDTDEN